AILEESLNTQKTETGPPVVSSLKDDRLKNTGFRKAVYDGLSSRFGKKCFSFVEFKEICNSELGERNVRAGKTLVSKLKTSMISTKHIIRTHKRLAPGTGSITERVYSVV